jgi:hypothetical protein
MVMEPAVIDPPTATQLYQILRKIVLLDSEPEPGLFTWQMMRAQAHEEAKAAIAKAEGR